MCSEMKSVAPHTCCRRTALLEFRMHQYRQTTCAAHVVANNGTVVADVLGLCRRLDPTASTLEVGAAARRSTGRCADSAPQLPGG